MYNIYIYIIIYIILPLVLLFFCARRVVLLELFSPALFLDPFFPPFLLHPLVHHPLLPTLSCN